jgi:hypothetical protein
MAHTVTTTIATNAAGAITGYGLSIQAATSGDPEEIAACIVASLAMLQQTIAASFAPTTVADPPSPLAASRPFVPFVDHPPTNPPATPEEACTRFFARYGAIVGGQAWADVQRYLRQPRRPEPATVARWIAAAEAVRDRSRAQPPSRP